MPSAIDCLRGIAIRLPDERWEHICSQHHDLSGHQQAILWTIAHAEAVYQGPAGELLATAEIESGKWLVVVYRIDELQGDGFVITAYATRRRSALLRWRQLWPRRL